MAPLPTHAHTHTTLPITGHKNENNELATNRRNAIESITKDKTISRISIYFRNEFILVWICSFGAVKKKVNNIGVVVQQLRNKTNKPAPNEYNAFVIAFPRREYEMKTTQKVVGTWVFFVLCMVPFFFSND